MQWIQEHWEEIGAILAAVYTIASIIVAWTPTPKDDEVLKRFMEWLSFLTPFDTPGTLKRPLSSRKR